jgi:hypothetical protein
VFVILNKKNWPSGVKMTERMRVKDKLFMEDERT